MIKAVAGGGGRGMRQAHNDVSLVQGFNSARMEAEKAFNNGALYLEKLIENPHHIEFQILADRYKKVVHVGERDCSIQRRNQKLLEESPSPFITPAVRKAMGRAAIKLAQAVDYENAGTIEFLVDDKQHFYFMEMNTRIQVEHPVTEEVYGVDLVKEQIRIAFGEKLSKDFDDLQPQKHAIEMRINAEGPLQRLPAQPGQDRAVLRARRPWHPLGFARLRRLQRAALLRLDDRQADRLRQRSRHRHGPDVARAGRVYHSRHQDHRAFRPAHPEGPPISAAAATAPISSRAFSSSARPSCRARG